MLNITAKCRPTNVEYDIQDKAIVCYDVTIIIENVNKLLPFSNIKDFKKGFK